MPTTLQEWAWLGAIVGAVITLVVFLRPLALRLWMRVTSSTRAFFYRIESAMLRVESELGPNGGGSMRDRITSIDRRTRETAAIQRAMFAAWDKPVFQTDPLGNFTTVNREVEQLTGYAERDLFGMGWVNVIHPEDSDEFMRSWRYAIHDRRIFRRTCRLLTERGQVVTVCVDMKPMRDNVDGVLGWVGSMEREDAA
jgi:PAS domain S-box-containing protein